MSGFMTNNHYAQTAGVDGVANNATFRGAWFKIEDQHSVGIQVQLDATASPTAVWTVELTDDLDAGIKADADLIPGIATMTPTAEMTANNPAGTTTARQLVFTLDPSPRAKWMRFAYVRSAGGDATATRLKIAICTYSDRA